MDYGLFFSAFSLIILALISRRFFGDKLIRLSWLWLSAYGIFSSAYYWLILVAGIFGEAPYLILIRHILLLLAYFALIEFGRSSLKKHGLTISAALIYIVLAVFVVVSLAIGMSVFYAFVRILCGLIAFTMVLVLIRHLRQIVYSNNNYIAWLGGIFFLYALTVLLFSHVSSNSTLYIFGEQAFQNIFKISVFVVRGALVYIIAFSLWLFASAQKDLYFFIDKKYSTIQPVRRASVLIAVLLISGFLGTNYLGKMARENVLKNELAYSTNLANQLKYEMNLAGQSITGIAGSHWLGIALEKNTREAKRMSNNLLVRYNNSLKAERCFILDRTGRAVLSSDSKNKENILGQNFNARSYFRNVLKGGNASYFGIDPLTEKQQFYSSYPVKTKDGRIVGVLVMMRDISKLFDKIYLRYPNTFFIDPNGIIFLSGREDMLYRTLWPVSREQKLQFHVTKQFQKVNYTPLFEQKFNSGELVSFDGLTHLAVLNSVTDEGWSIVVLDDIFSIKINRLFSILIVFSVTLLVSFFFSVLERTRTAAALTAQSEEQFRTMFETAPEAIFIVDPSTFSIIESNSLMAEMLDYSRTGLLERNLEDLLQGGFPEFKEYMGKSNRKEKIRISNYAFFNRRGGIVHIEGNCAYIHFKNTNSLIFFLHDVSERKKTEKEIKENERKYRNLFDNASDSIILINDGKIFDCNTKSCEMFGLNREQLIGMDPGCFLPKEQSNGQDSVDLLLQNLVLAMQGMNRRFTCQYKRSDQSLFDAEVSLNRVDVQGELMIQSIYRDVSEQKQLERNLKEARDRALEASALKSEFLANMSHEIRTPMNGVLGMLELITGTKLNTDQKDYIETAKTSATSLMTIINDILDFSKMEAGKLHIEQVEFNVRSLIESIGETLAKDAHEKNLELVCYIDNRVPDYLEGDPGRIRQVMTNFLNNAIKFTKEGEVLFGCLQQKESADQNIVQFFVQDSGIGIAKDKQDRIFNAFQQADGSMTRKFGGTGLGLTISRQLIELMKGKLHLKSALGQGSTFAFSLEFAKNGSRFEQPPALDNDIRSKKMLIVDDNKTSRQVTNQMVNYFGMKASSAAGGAQAVKILNAAAAEKKPYQVLILDIKMSEISGKDVLMQLQADVKYNDLDIIALCSAVQNGESSWWQNQDNVQLINKPLKRSRLLQAINDIEKTADVSEKAIPAARPASADKKSVPENGSNGLRILLTDDNKINQKVAMRIIQNGGYHVTVANNGKEAFEKVFEETFDLVLMDVQMPVMDGYEATASIREKENGSKRIPIIAMTAHAMKGDREKCLESGMDDYMTKPLQKDKLFAIIEKYIRDTQNQN